MSGQDVRIKYPPPSRDPVAYAHGWYEHVSATATTTLTSLIAVRLQAGTSDAQIRRVRVGLVNDGAQVVRWELAYISAATASSIGLTTWAAADQGGAFAGATEVSTQAGSLVTADKRVRLQGVVAGGGQIAESEDVTVTPIVDQSSRVAVLSVETVTGTATVYGTLQWEEVY